VLLSIFFQSIALEWLAMVGYRMPDTDCWGSQSRAERAAGNLTCRQGQKVVFALMQVIQSD